MNADDTDWIYSEAKLLVLLLRGPAGSWVGSGFASVGTVSSWLWMQITRAIQGVEEDITNSKKG